MLDEQKLYGGAGVSVAGANPNPVKIPDIALAEAQNASQRSSHNTDNAISGFARINDFGQEQDARMKVRDLELGGETELKRRLALPAGHTNSFYEKDGSFKEHELKDFIYKQGQQIDGVNASFISPAARMEWDYRKQDAARSLEGRYYAVVSDHQIGAARRSFSDSMDVLERNKEWGTAYDSIDRAVLSGTISEDQGNSLKYDLNQKSMVHALDGLVTSKPGEAFDRIEAGEFGNLEPSVLRRYRDMAEDGLRNTAERAPLTPEEMKAAAEGRAVKPRFKVRNGATREEWDLRASFERQGYYTPEQKDQIRGMWEEELANAPVPKDEAGRKRWVDEFVKKWSNDENGYKADPNELSLRAADRMAELAGEVDTNNRVDIDSFVAKVPENMISPGGRSFWSGKEKDDERVYTQRMTVGSRVKSAMANWRSTHPKATYDQDMAQAGEFVRRFVQELGYGESKNPAKEGKEIADGMAGMDLRPKGISGKEEQNENHRKWLNRQKEYTPMPQRVYSRLMPTPVTPVPGNEEGVYVPQAVYDKLRQKFGENVSAEVILPNKAFARVPVLGGYDGEDVGVQMTGAARKRLASFDPGTANMRFYAGEKRPAVKIQGVKTSVTGAPTASLDVLKRHAGGLADHANDFLEVGQKAGVDPALLMAIAQVETGNGTSSAFKKKLNAMGVSPNGGGPRSFGSVRESIEYMAARLKSNYIDKGLTDIASIGAKYSPVGAANDPNGTNHTWADQVAARYAKIKKQA